jgi:hypothetical protein
MLDAVSTTLRTYFENSVGCLLEHPTEGFIEVHYHTGPRQLSELHVFLNQAGQLLAQRGWNKVRGTENLLPAFTSEELEWVTEYWLSKQYQGTDLYSALLLPHEVLARLSWKGNGVNIMK